MSYIGLATGWVGSSLPDDKYLALVNEEWARPLSIGTGWDRIRIGVLFSLGRSEAGTAPNCKFYIGMTNGASGTVGQNNTSGFVGFCPFSNATLASVSGGAAMTVTANGPTGIVNAGTTSYFFTKSGSVLSNISGFTYIGGGNVRAFNHSGIAHVTGMTRFAGKTLNMFEIKKIPPNHFILTGFALAQTTVPPDVTEEEFSNSMFTELASIPYVAYWGANNYSYNATSIIIPRDPITSGLDTVNIFGFNGTNSINIYDVRVWRFS